MELPGSVARAPRIPSFRRAAGSGQVPRFRLRPSPAGRELPPTNAARMTGIDWATERKKIEREYDGLPPEPTPAALNRKRAEERREQERLHDAALRIGAWTRALLVISLATAINFWPYFRDCGVGLF